MTLHSRSEGMNPTGGNVIAMRICNVISKLFKEMATEGSSAPASRQPKKQSEMHHGCADAVIISSAQPSTTPGVKAQVLHGNLESFILHPPPKPRKGRYSRWMCYCFRALLAPLNLLLQMI